MYKSGIHLYIDPGTGSMLFTILLGFIGAGMFDFALVFDRPVIYAEYELDKSVYDACWIEHPLWQEKIFPMLGTPLKESDFNKLKDIIESAISSEKYAVARSRAKAEAWMYIGESAKRTVDFLTRQESIIV